MKEEHEFVSRPVKIKFKNSNSEIEGNIIFVDQQHSYGEIVSLSSQFKFRFRDPSEEGCYFDFWDVDMITYL